MLIYIELCLHSERHWIDASILKDMLQVTLNIVTFLICENTNAIFLTIPIEINSFNDNYVGTDIIAVSADARYDSGSFNNIRMI